MKYKCTVCNVARTHRRPPSNQCVSCRPSRRGSHFIIIDADNKAVDHAKKSVDHATQSVERKRVQTDDIAYGSKMLGQKSSASLNPQLMLVYPCFTFCTKAFVLQDFAKVVSDSRVATLIRLNICTDDYEYHSLMASFHHLISRKLFSFRPCRVEFAISTLACLLKMAAAISPYPCNKAEDKCKRVWASICPDVDTLFLSAECKLMTLVGSV